MRRTADVVPTLDDSDVVSFCRNGYLVLESVIDARTNERTRAYLDKEPAGAPERLLSEPWFTDEVMLHPEVAGAVRSLLGAGFHLPQRLTNHRKVAPVDGDGPWHIDGNFRFTHELDNLLIFYYPQDTPVELGPTEILPGSHLVHNTTRAMAHYDWIEGSVTTAAPAGSVFVTSYQLWHRATRATGRGRREMLKYFCWRTTAPVRDWVVDEALDLSEVNFANPLADALDPYFDSAGPARMYCWLAGHGDSYANPGGQSWPLRLKTTSRIYGFPEPLAPGAPSQDAVAGS